MLPLSAEGIPAGGDVVDSSMTAALVALGITAKEVIVEFVPLSVTLLAEDGAGNGR